MKGAPYSTLLMKGALCSTVQMLAVQALCLGLQAICKAVLMEDTALGRVLSPLEAPVMKARPLTH